MTRFYLTSAVALFLAACATEPPSQPASESTARATSAPATAGAETPAAADDESIVAVDTPDIPEAEVTDEQLGIPDPDERICRRERRTGTHRAQRVCYTRAEIERMADESREMLDDMNRTSRAPLDQ